jgi:hypothetical protein
MTFNLLILFIVYISSYLSISAFGIVLNKLLNLNKFDYEPNNLTSFFFLGLPFFLLISFLNFIIFQFNTILNLIIILLGLLFFFYKNKILNILKISFIPVLLFIGLIISKTHDDFVLYHFQFLKEISTAPIKFGMANIDIRYGYSSLFSYIQGGFIFPYYSLSFFHVPIFLIYVSLINFLFFNSLKLRNEKKFLVIFIQIFFLLKFKRLSEFGYDHIIQFLLTYLFINFFLFKDKENLSKNLIIYFFAISLKIVSIFFLPLIIFFIKNNFYQFKIIFKNKLLILFFLLLSSIIIFDSFIKTGCLHYSIVYSCFSTQAISWSVSIDDLLNNKKMIELWAKGFYHQKINFINNSDYYLSNFYWMKNWIIIHFYEKIIDSIFVVIIIFSIIYTFCQKNKHKIKINKKLFLFLLFSFLMWLLILPQYRFGFLVIILVSFFLLRIFLNKRIIIKNSVFLFLFSISVIFYNFENYLRITNEFERSDEYKFINFPFFNIPERFYKKEMLNYGLFYHSPIDDLKSCFNINSICSLKKIQLEYFDFYFTKILIIKSNKD